MGLTRRNGGASTSCGRHHAIALGIGPARGTDSVIALNSPNTGDGRGIDHLFPVLVGVALDCGYELDF
jgi:hypothetical protein